MFVILVYDVNQKRVAKTRKICRKYLTPIQRSVFEGDLTRRQLTMLQDELKRFLEPEEDSVCFYEFESMRYSHKNQFGKIEENGNIL